MRIHSAPIQFFSIAAVSFVLGTASLPAADPQVGLVSYWPLDTADGGITPDASTLANTLTINNTPSVVPGKVGNAFAFDGTSTSPYLSASHGFTDNDLNGLPIYTSPNGYTIAMWIKGPPVGPGGNANDGYIFTEGSTASTAPIFMLQTRNGSVETDTNKLDVFIRTSGNATLMNHRKSSSVVFDDQWHHIAWVDSQGTAKLYVDGNLDGTDFNYVYSPPSAFSFSTTAIAALIRTSVASTHFNGLIDEVAIWDRPLSQAEVQEVINNGIPTPIPAPALAVWQPPASNTNALGARATFSVGAAGAQPVGLTYQWYLDGSPLVDKTASSLVLTNLTAPGTSVYSVTVTKASETVSNFAYLAVLPDPTPDLRTGLVSYWPLDEVDDQPPIGTPDIYYRHTDLLLSGMDSTALTIGRFGNALSFGTTGPNQYGLRSGGTPIYTTTNYTVAFWVSGAPSQANKQVFGEGGTNATGANGHYFLLGTENPAGGGLLDVKSSLSPWLSDRKSTQVVFDYNWHHLAWVDENGKARLYVDGVVDETDFTYYRSNLVLTATALGALYRSSAANFFAGSVDDLALWDRALTWTEIQELRTNGVPPPETLIPPTITEQPLGSTNHLGDRVILSVVATGSQPLTYQWYKDGSPVADGTDSSLTLFLISPATNDFWVVIQNLADSITSDTAHLEVSTDPTPDLRAGLFYYWPLDTVDDGPPATTPDVYSHDDLVLDSMDSFSLVPGQFGNALSFFGYQYGSRVGGYPIYLTTNYTISMWVNGFGLGQADARVFSEGSSANGVPLFTIGTDNGGLSESADFYLRTDAGTTLLAHRKSARAVFDGLWHHLVWVDANGKARLYVDGVLDEADFSYTRGTLTLDKTAIGAVLRAAAGNFFSGTIDEVALWDRTLTWSEMEQVRAGNIPPQNTIVPPSIFADPQDVTNFTFSSSPVALNVLVSGTGTLSYQWRKDGINLDTGVNPSAATSTLTLTNLQAGDIGGYSVVVANSAGSVTSQVAQVSLTAEPFKLDFGLNGSPNAQPGFLEMALSTSGATLGGIRVSVTQVGGITLADRNRTTGAMVVNNPPLLTQAQIYNDFIFGYNNSILGSGLSVLIEHLTPNTQFGLTVWSFDPGSGGARISDWTNLTAGAEMAIATGYTFDGAVQPTHDYDNTLGALLTSSPDGTLEFEGLKAGDNYCVFLNALQLAAEPAIRITNAQQLGDSLRLTIETQYPAQPISFEESATLDGGGWSPATGGQILEAHGPIVTAEFPIGSGSLFYRVVAAD